MTGATELRIGQIRRRVQLGSEAVYRVCGWTDQLAEVEVVHAPGLRPGQRFNFDLAAVQRMALVAAPSDPTGPTRQGSQIPHPD